MLAKGGIVPLKAVIWLALRFLLGKHVTLLPLDSIAYGDPVIVRAHNSIVISRLRVVMSGDALVLSERVFLLPRGDPAVGKHVIILPKDVLVRGEGGQQGAAGCIVLGRLVIVIRKHDVVLAAHLLVLPAGIRGWLRHSS